MRKALFFALAVLAAYVMVGCSSGGGTVTPTTVTRFITGFIYVKGDGSGGSGPGAVVTNSSNPPTGYFAPDSGVLHVAAPVGGDVSTRAPFVDVDVSTGTGNSFILKVTGVGDGTAQVTFSTLTPFARSSGPAVSAKSVTTYAVNLGTVANNNTTLLCASGTDFTYTPGAPAALSVTVDGHAPTSTETFVSGRAGGYAVACAVLDRNGVAISGVPITFSTLNVPNAGTARTSINGSGTLTPAQVPTTATAGNVSVTCAVSVGANLQETFSAAFSFGTPSSATLVSAGNKTTLLWDVTGTVPPLDTLALSGVVKNENNVPLPGAAYTFSATNVTGTTWNNANGPAFASAVSGNTDANGAYTMTFNAPAKKDAVLSNTDKALKGANIITFTSGAAAPTLNIVVLRPLKTITTAGPARLDTNSTSGTYTITGGTDVDNDAVTPARVVGPFAWTVTPLGNGGGTTMVGDPDDLSVRSVAAPVPSGQNTATLTLGPGTIPGQCTVSVSNGTISSTNIVVDIFGNASKLVLTPTTTAQGYHGNAGFQKTFSVDVIDSFGHKVTAEATFNAKTGSTPSNSGENIIWPPLPDLTYTVTAGPASGTFQIILGGSWAGTQGGSGSFSISRTVALTIP